MTRIETPKDPADLAAGNDYFLYVEGKQAGASRENVLEHLLYRLRHVRVIQVGGHGNVMALAQEDWQLQQDVRSLATAMVAAERRPPGRAFAIIDRDCRYRAPEEEDRYIEQRWAEPFKTNAHPRLLTWRRHELENYFLEPALLMHCSLRRTEVCQADIEAALLSRARERVYLDALNLTIKEVGMTLKSYGVQEMVQPAGVAMSLEEAREKLRRLPWQAERERRTAMLAEDTAGGLMERFAGWVDLLTGGAQSLELGRGQWLARMCGKELLGCVVNSQFFKVQDPRGRLVQGALLEEEVLKDLAQQMPELSETPAEFKALVKFFRDLGGGA